MPTLEELDEMTQMLGFCCTFDRLRSVDRETVLRLALDCTRNSILADQQTTLENIEMRLRNL